MAPGLLDGDQIRWEPSGSNLPARLSRVVCQSPHEGVAVKRLIGFGGERVCCRSGELSIDGAIVKKSPPQLAALATAVCDDPADWQPQSQWWQLIGDHWRSAGVPANQLAWLRFEPDGRDSRLLGGPGVFYDDSPWLEGERRRLEIVRDVGLTAVIEVKSKPGSTSEVVLQVGHQAARLLLRGGGQLICVAGLLDGRFVVAAWPLRGDADDVPPLADNLLGAGRQLFPAGLPAQWRETVPIPEAAQPVPIQIGVRTLTEAAGFTISRLLIWRDAHWLPHGVQACSEVPPGHVFVLGDCPVASRDSRQWGPLPAAAVVGRVVAAEGVNINPNESD